MAGNFTDAQLRPLLKKLLDEELSAEDEQQLESLLAASGESREFYRRYLSVHTMLEWHLIGPAPVGVGTGAESTTRVPSGQADVVARLAKRPRLVAFSAAALSLAAILTAMWFMVPPFYRAMTQREEQPAIPTRVIAARITALHGVQWAKGQTPWRNGAQLVTGRRLEISQGMIELTYVTGTRVAIQAPAVFVIGTQTNSEGGEPNANSGSLELGRLVAHVPNAKAKGFFIDAPQVRIEDLSTEFGVEVSETGATEVAVISGAVDLISDGKAETPPQRTRLRTGQGVSIAPHDARHVVIRNASRQPWKEILQSRESQPDPEQPASGVVVNVNFTCPRAAESVVQNSSYGSGQGQLLAPVPYRGTRWTNIDGHNGTASRLVDSEGNATAVGVAVRGAEGNYFFDNGKNYMDVIDGYGFVKDAEATLTLTGLQRGQQYRLHIVMRGGDKSGQGGVALLVSGAAQLPAAVTATGTDLSEATYVRGRNFVTLSLVSDGKPAVVRISPNNLDPHAVFNGLQIESLTNDVGPHGGPDE